MRLVPGEDVSLQPHRRCECCGQIIPPKLIIAGPIRNAIYQYVANHPEGVTCHQLADHVYPVDGWEKSKLVRIHVIHLNKVLRGHGLKITTGQKGGPGGLYKLCSL